MAPSMQKNGYINNNNIDLKSNIQYIGANQGFLHHHHHRALFYDITRVGAQFYDITRVEAQFYDITMVGAQFYDITRVGPSFTT